VSRFDDGTTIVTERLSLVPLRVEDAEEMTGVLDDEQHHEFIDGGPETITGLRERYARLAAGSPDADEVWLNWVVRRRSDAQPMGTVQATLTLRDGESAANVAWVIGVDWQNQGSRQRRPEPSSTDSGSAVPTTSSPTSIPIIRPRRRSQCEPASDPPLSKQTANVCGERPTVVLDPQSLSGR